MPKFQKSESASCEIVLDAGISEVMHEIMPRDHYVEVVIVPTDIGTSGEIKFALPASALQSQIELRPGTKLRMAIEFPMEGAKDGNCLRGHTR